MTTSIVTCDTGKICYASPQAAWDAATKIRTRTRSTATKNRGRQSHPYQCETCVQWHLTSSKER